MSFLDFLKLLGFWVFFIKNSKHANIVFCFCFFEFLDFLFEHTKNACGITWILKVQQFLFFWISCFCGFLDCSPNQKHARFFVFSILLGPWILFAMFSFENSQTCKRHFSNSWFFFISKIHKMQALLFFVFFCFFVFWEFQNSYFLFKHSKNASVLFRFFGFWILEFSDYFCFKNSKTRNCYLFVFFVFLVVLLFFLSNIKKTQALFLDFWIVFWTFGFLISFCFQNSKTRKRCFFCFLVSGIIFTLPGNKFLMCFQK